ncbi:uncharacterized protein LOC141772565 isoform X2 [Sebastes fasciatus]|uniref:uncharacterized protein LOC141772565 isoform X2 n=1 Tax=Sebastes fasciatus TaxID=394691 RepID=UPI003D9FA63E
MTAKHRRGKGNHKNEDNFFKNEVAESEVRGGSNNYALHLVLFLLVVVCGATGAWFCFQQHQTLTYLTDNLMGMQMKIVKLQSSHEQMRQSSSEHVSESLETRLNALEDSYALAQKQVGMALATAEQLKTSDLPAQVLSLHMEMKARLAEMQQATVSLDQLSQLQGMLKGKSEEFEGVRIQVEGLALLSAELSQRVEGLTGSVGEAESKLEERGGQVATLSATLDGQAAEVLRLKEQLENYQAQLEASTLEMATVRGLLESEQSQQLEQASVEEQLNTPVGQTEEEETAPPAAEGEAATEEEALPVDVEQEASDPEETAPPAAEEEAAAEEATEEEVLPADVEQEAVPEAEADEGGEAAAQDEAPVEQEDSVTDETAPAEEAEAVTEDQTEEDELVAVSEKTAEEGVQSEEENQEADEEETHKAEEENEVSEGEEEVSERQEEPQDVAAEEEAEEMDEGEEPLENDALPEDEL